MSEANPKYDLTGEDIKVISALEDVATGSFNSAGDFIDSMKRIKDKPELQISKRQRDYAWYLVFRYRRQIKDKSLVEQARIKISNGEIGYATDNDKIVAAKPIPDEPEENKNQLNLF